jgi:uncharacterized protein YcgI (DUF1989 family)
MLTVIEDTSEGIHDTLIGACDRYRYTFLGVAGHHDNCADNLQLALHELHFACVHVPSPLNLFMHIPWDEAGGLQFVPPPARCRAAMSSSAPKWTLSSPSRRARRTSCRSTAAPAVRSRRMSW